MKKSTKKRIRDIRSALVMVLVMVAMLSTASYAWFTLTDSPTVSNMQMTAASTSGLKVANNEALSDMADAIEILDQETKMLRPVTSTGAGKFEEPVYSANIVKGLKELTDITNYVAHYTYYLKSTDETAGTIDIGIICGDATQTDEMKVDAGLPSLNGSLVRKSPDANNTKENAAYAVRVELVVDGVAERIIWEPNADKTIDGTTTSATSEVDNTITDDPTIVSKENGEITEGAGTEENTITGKLFTMNKGASKKIDMYIWIQGNDEQCVDQIQASDIEAQIQFTIVGETTTTS